MKVRVMYRDLIIPSRSGHRLLGEPMARGPGVGKGDDHIGVHRRLARKLATHLAARLVQRPPLHHRVGRAK